MEAELNAARAGMSGTLVIRGDAGVGKTSVLDHTAQSAEDFMVVRVDGVESEQAVGFAALHRLLLPLWTYSEVLPPPQRRALDAVLGRVDGSPPDRFLVGLAVLTLLAAAAEVRPVLCLVDDAQWIDGESADLLAFVARRLLAERVVIVLAARDLVDVRDAFPGLPELRLTGLEPADARELLASVADQPAETAMIERILAETEGNPLALIELGRDLGSAAGAVLLPGEPLSLGRRLEEHFLRQVRSLTPAAQQFLLIAAAESSDPALVWKAAQLLRVPLHAADDAREARLLNPGYAPTFRHPLIRAAVYGAASASQRRRVHAALAQAAEGSELDSRAFHLAAAADGPDESVAAELERGAERAENRGGWAARFAFLARAAELTPAGALKQERMLAAAQAALVAGMPTKADQLVKRAKERLTDPHQLAQAMRIEAALLSFTTPGKVPSILLGAATSLQALDLGMAHDTFIEALQASLVSCQLTFDTTPAAVGAAALAAPRPDDPQPEVNDAIVEGFATRFAVGYREAAPALRGVVEALSVNETLHAGLTRWAILGNNAAADLWDADGFRQMLVKLEHSERQRGALDSLRITLGGMGHCLMWSGDFAAAEVAHSEATQISVALGEQAANFESLKVELFAWQGRDEDTRFVADLLTGEFTHRIGGGVAVNLAREALVILNLAQGHYEEALGHALKLMMDDPCPHGSQVLPDAVEAAARTGDRTSAQAAMDRLRLRALASGTPWALGLLARSEALTTDDDPEAKFRRAVDLLSQTYVKTDLARAHLLYGEWLRREKKRNDARDHLRVAFELFDRMGAAAFAERTRVELAATGERARRRTVDATRELTPQERQIATLASYGATNQEIAEKLFLSASTVDYHLRKVFRKLSVTSRRKLGVELGVATDKM